MARKEYDIKITVNGRAINKVVIDSHYEDRHSESIDDQIVLALVSQLDGKFFEAKVVAPFSYFMTDKMLLGKKFYKLIWLLEEDKPYIGVVNAYRR